MALFEAHYGVTSSGVGRVLVGCWWLFSSIILTSTINGNASWKLLVSLYPNVNFCRPSLVDPLRFCIQSIWLLFVLLSKLLSLFFYFPSWIAMGARFVLTTLKRKISFVGKRITDFEHRNERSDNKAQSTSKLIVNKVILAFFLSVFAAIATVFVMVPLSLEQQIMSVGIITLVAFVLRSVPGRISLLVMMSISAIVSTRYIWWRLSETINWHDAMSTAFGVILLCAEVYAWVVLMLGYFQNSWPLNRVPKQLVSDTTKWPSVDVFIPSYNEPLDVVRATVFAAQGIDWPKDKLNIYILDDGKRTEFEEFAELAHVGYITRTTNEHAKAGNINKALLKTDGDFIAIFDCDHIPTRAFLQLTMGLFQEDPNLALIQTPHHFFSPDPFERNLNNFRSVPNEGSLFYGLVQDGNDLWDAAFFCGSCAIIKRGPLQEVGGIAVETVTEDAHTSLRLHRLGYKSAYLKQPLSAGLATETLSAHIGQRIRWARGMAQIFRIDNPLAGVGLNWRQRLCYLNAMLHFLSGIPRMIFLLAPLGYLVFGAHIIDAPAVALLAYVIPHMVISNITNSKIQGKYRYSFWGEVYETVLAWYIARPTTVALFAPHKGTFNVTAKGGLIPSSHFDWLISTPYLVFMGLNLIGVIFGLFKLDLDDFGTSSTIAVNLMWTAYNLLIIGAAIAIAQESKQVRKEHRVGTAFSAQMKIPGGYRVETEMIDFSLSGVKLKWNIESELGHQLTSGDKVMLILQKGQQRCSFDANVIAVDASSCRLQFETMSLAKQVEYVQCTFARSDIWSRWQNEYKHDKPLDSLLQIFNAGGVGYYQLVKNICNVKLGRYKPLLPVAKLLVSLKPHPILKEF